MRLLYHFQTIINIVMTAQEIAVTKPTIRYSRIIRMSHRATVT